MVDDVVIAFVTFIVDPLFAAFTALARDVYPLEPILQTFVAADAEYERMKHKRIAKNIVRNDFNRYLCLFISHFLLSYS